GSERVLSGGDLPMRKAFLALFLTGTVFALSQDTSKSSDADDFAAVEQEPRSPSAVSIGDSDLTQALELARVGRYVEASSRLFQLSYSPRFLNRRMQIKYVLGLTLQKMKLPQLAAFQYISVVKDGNSHYATQALEKLSQVADKLEDDSLLNYAYS